MKIYEDILHKEICEQLTKEVIEAEKGGKLSKETGTFYRYSCGINDFKPVIETLPLIESVIKKDFPHAIFENTYTRIYRNGSFLKHHTDRVNLDLTLSVCLYSDVDMKWPLCVSRKVFEGLWDDSPFELYSDDYDKILTPVGTGAIMLGTKSVHWRDTLMCKPEQKVIQTFYHWKLPK